MNELERLVGELRELREASGPFSVAGLSPERASELTLLKASEWKNNFNPADDHSSSEKLKRDLEHDGPRALNGLILSDGIELRLIHPPLEGSPSLVALEAGDEDRNQAQSDYDLGDHVEVRCPGIEMWKGIVVGKRFWASVNHWVYEVSKNDAPPWKNIPPYWLTNAD